MNDELSFNHKLSLLYVSLTTCVSIGIVKKKRVLNLMAVLWFVQNDTAIFAWLSS